MGLEEKCRCERQPEIEIDFESVNPTKPLE
jgi:hypothetical protein